MYFNLEPVGIEFGKLRICMDIFAELGLAEFHPFSRRVKKIPVDKKVNLDDSAILRRLNEYNG